jgi:hypothetical protein
VADRKKASFFEKAIVSVDLANLSTLNIIWKVFGIHLVLLPADFLGKNKLAHSKEHIGSGGRNWIKFLEPSRPHMTGTQSAESIMASGHGTRPHK